MVQVDNKKTIQALTNCFIKKYRKNTAALTLTITIIITLVVSLLTLIHTNHWLEAMQNQFIYTNIDYQISGLNNSQIKMLENNDKLEQLGIKRYQAFVTSDYQSASVVAANDSSILAVSTLLSGHMPSAENEVVAEKWALLNLGINPVVGSEFTFDTTYHESDSTNSVTYKLVGIINDISLNKLSGSLNLYTGMDTSVKNDYIAEIKCKDDVSTEKVIERIEKSLDIPSKAISQNPWHEDTTELILIDCKTGMLLLVICFVIVWGIYRISLLARQEQYGILRAVGVTKKQIKNMIMSELYKLYLISIPLGIIFGTIIANLVTLLSRNNDMEIYFWGEKQSFNIVFPIIPVVVCMLGVGFVLILISLLGSHKVNSQTIMSAITGPAKEDMKKLSLFTLSEKEDLFLDKKLGMKYIFCKSKTSLLIILSLATGCILFYGLSYQAILSSAQTTVKTEENFYNSDYILTSNDDMSAVNGIKKDTIKQAQQISEIVNTETQMAMPVKVIDDGTSRIHEYFADKEKIIQKIYGFSMQNSFDKESVFHTKLKGYNTEALKNLKKYLVEGNFDPTNIKSDEVILAMPRMSEYGKSKGITGFFKHGTAVMQYKVGQNITVKYRSDFDTTSDEYWNGTDTTDQYSTAKYKVAAIVYYPYMKQVSVVEQVYPLLITNEDNYTNLNPAGVYETVNLFLHDTVTDKRQEEIEQELIALSVENQQVTARSLIEEKAKLDMMYRKELVYIYGIAIAVFILILVNLINSLKYRIQTRKSEFYIYRAIGMDFKFQSNMIQFENMVFGIISLLITFIVSHILAHYLYVDSGIYVYGISYNYNYLIFIILTVFTLLICFIVSKLLCCHLKDENILSELNKIE